jgi:hypothetical protein
MANAIDRLLTLEAWEDALPILEVLEKWCRDTYRNPGYDEDDYRKTVDERLEKIQGGTP